MPDVPFSDWINGLVVDTLTGPEKLPLLDGTTSKHATAALLAAFTIDQLHQASVITTVADSDELNVFQSDVEKIITAQNFFNWIVDKLEAIGVETTILSGDKLLYVDGGVLKQIDIDNVRTFINAGVESLGSQIAALTAATLADSDQYVVAQGTTARKTTFTSIASRVHSQFLTYLGTLPSVVTVVDGDTFYINDGGTASKVTAAVLATYMQSKISTDAVSAAWDTYAALGAATNATDVFLLERSGTGRTATGANIASYVVGTQNSAADAVGAVVGDDFLIFRSGTQFKLDIGLLSTYVLASGWSATSGNPVATGDKVLIGRAGTTLSVTVDQLETYILNGVQADVLNLTGLTSATLASGSLLLIGDGSNARKATLAELETKLWADFEDYVSALTALNPLEDADVFYVIEGTTPKKITAANIASYAETEMWDKTDVGSVSAGDDIWMRRGSTSYKLDVGVFATYVGGVLAGSIDIGALADAAISDNDLFLIQDGGVGGVNRKATVANIASYIEGKMWSKVDASPAVQAGDDIWMRRGSTSYKLDVDAFASYVTGVTSGNIDLTVLADATVSNDDLMLLSEGGANRKATVGQLWSNRYLYDAQAIKLDDFAAPDDNTDRNASTSAHGLMPKLANNTAQFFRADGSQSVPHGGATSTATAAGTTVLTVLSNRTQIFTGSTTQTVTLPVTSTLELGHPFRVINNSTGAVTVNSSGGNAVLIVRPGSEATFTCVLTSGTTAASWVQDRITTKCVPQNSQSDAYTTTISDANGHIYHPSADTTARIWTIDSNANVPYPIGTELTFVNDTSAGVITIAITADTLVLAGAGTTGSRTLAASGIAKAIKMTATRWMISGTGLT
jgi:hypothetical protein